MQDQPEAASKIRVFYLNLLSDEKRLSHLMAQTGSLDRFSFCRVAGVDGATLPELARQALVLDRSWAQQKGTIGCSLSHVAVWERVAAHEAPFSIVIEDDVDIGGLARLADYALPDDADLIFINDRMVPPRPEPAGPRVLPIAATLEHLDTRTTAMGADGYILYRHAARKLLDAVERDLCYGHVDGRLLRYCVSEADIAGLPADSWIASVVRCHHNPARPPAAGILKGYCASSPLIRHGGFPRTREMFDRV